MEEPSTPEVSSTRAGSDAAPNSVKLSLSQSCIAAAHINSADLKAAADDPTVRSALARLSIQQMKMDEDSEALTRAVLEVGALTSNSHIELI